VEPLSANPCPFLALVPAKSLPAAGAGDRSAGANAPASHACPGGGPVPALDGAHPRWQVMHRRRCSAAGGAAGSPPADQPLLPRAHRGQQRPFRRLRGGHGLCRGGGAPAIGRTVPQAESQRAGPGFAGVPASERQQANRGTQLVALGSRGRLAPSRGPWQRSGRARPAPVGAGDR